MKISFTIYLKPTNFQNNVICYRAGFVVRKLKCFIRCSDCLECCFATNDKNNNNIYKLIMTKTSGGLISPSKDVVNIFLAAEKAIRRFMVSSNLGHKKWNFEQLIIYLSKKALNIFSQMA